MIWGLQAFLGAIRSSCDNGVMSNRSEVVITPEGRMYHLGIASDEIARCLFLVGDPDRAYRVARRFESIDHEVLK